MKPEITVCIKWPRRRRKPRPGRLVPRIYQAIELDATPVRTPHLERRIKRQHDMTTVLTNTQKVRVELEPFTNRLGGPAAVDGAPAWSTDDASLVALNVDADGMGAWVETIGPTGSCNVTATADVDLGDGFKPLEFTDQFVVDPAEAAAGGFRIGEPVERDAPPA